MRRRVADEQSAEQVGGDDPERRFSPGALSRLWAELEELRNQRLAAGQTFPPTNT
jgi:hypothetical protein